MKRLLSLVLVCALTLSLLPGVTVRAIDGEPAASKNENLLRIWYDEPATDWQTEALAIGNGYMGGMVFGGVAEDKIHLNEKTVWDGGPTATNGYNYGATNPTATEEDLNQIKADLDAIREKLDDKSEFVFGFDEDTYQDSGTDTMGEPMNWLNKLMGDLNGYDAPVDYADIWLDFSAGGQEDGGAANYIRDLDMRTGLATVSYDYEGVHYTREYFNSYPDNVLVIRLGANQDGKLTFDTSLTFAGSFSNRSITAAGDTITMLGNVSNGLKTEAQLKVLPVGGTLTANEDGTISVAGADTVTLVLACGTDYKMELPDFRGEDPHEAVTQRVADAAEKGYEALKRDHVADHSALFSRLEIGFNEEVPQIPTDELIEKYRNMVDGDGNSAPTESEQRALEIICYQFGRYLTIAGSREGALPTNLQGVWGEGSFAWGGDYHFNINVQMNYWPTMASNLGECLLPFNEYLEVLREAGREAAAAAYGIKSDAGEANGWLVGCFSTPYMFSALGQKNNAAGWNPIGSAWALVNAYEYYLYTGDTAYLRDHIYPSMKEVANFWNEALWWSEAQQRYVSAPSYSPEHGPIVNGASYDQQFIWQHFENTIQAAEILGVDKDLVAEWREKQSKLDPVLVGESGQVKEWFEETTFGKAQAGDLEEISIPRWQASLGAGEVAHRHLSHLMAMYPGTLINKDNDEFMDAAIVSLNQRGLAATGWSKAHKLNLWARTGQAENCFQIVQSAVGGGNSGFLTNLFSSHGGGANYKAYPIFQIDGNFGYTAGVNEMLLQSQLGYTQFLPALPAQWSNGFVNGIVSRGNFEIDMAWSDGKADRFTITSRNGGEFIGEYAGLGDCTVWDAAGNKVEATRESADRLSFETVKGESYTILTWTDVSKLNAEIAKAEETLAAMTGDDLTAAKGALSAVIDAAKTAAGTSSVDAFHKAYLALAAAQEPAEAALALNAAVNEADALYQNKEPLGEDSAIVKNALDSLQSAMNTAKAVLQNAGASAEALTAQTERLQAAMDEVNGAAAVGKMFTAKLAEAQTFYKESTSLGTVLTEALPLLENLSGAITEAEAVGKDPAAAAADYRKCISALDSAMIAIRELRGEATLTIRTTGGTLTIEASDPRYEIRYTLDGNEPTIVSRLYEEPISLPARNIAIKAALFLNGVKISENYVQNWNGGNLASSATVTESSLGWNEADLAIDGNESTVWYAYANQTPVYLTLTFEEPIIFDQAYVLGESYLGYPSKGLISYKNDESAEFTVLGEEVSFSDTVEANWKLEEAVTATQVQLTISEIGAGSSFIPLVEFQLSYSKSDIEANFDNLQNLLKDATEFKKTSGYLDAEQADKDRFDAYCEAAAAVANNENSDQDSVDAAAEALLDLLGKMGGIDPEQALALLNEQLTAARELAETLTTAEQARTLEILQDVIDAAEEAVASQAVTSYYSHTSALKSVIARTEQAVRLLDAVADARETYDTFEAKAGAWASARELLSELNGKIADAEALLDNAATAGDTLRRQIAALSDAQADVPALFDDLYLTITIEDGAAVMTASHDDVEIRYTLDGNTPSRVSTLYEDAVALPNRALTIKAALFAGNVKLTEDVVRTVSGSNVALGATATASCQNWDGYGPELLVDGNLTNRWAAYGATSADITIDLGSVESFQTVIVHQPAPLENGDVLARIVDLTIQVSETGEDETWTEVYNHTGFTPEDVTIDCALAELAEAQYVRLSITASSDPTICEIEICPPADPVEPVDKTALNAAIEAAKAADTTDASDEAKAELDELLAIAKEIAANGNSDQATVDAAVEALNAAVEGLARKYVTVHGGTGSGLYAPGAEVTITADPAPETRRFDKWIVNSENVELDDAGAEEAVFTMPGEPVEVTAVYVRAVTGVTLDRSEVTLKAGESTTLLATVTPADAAVQNITWASSDDDIVSVANGEITARNAGTATITVTTVDGGHTAECVVTVERVTSDKPSRPSQSTDSTKNPVETEKPALSGSVEVNVPPVTADANGEATASVSGSQMNTAIADAAKNNKAEIVVEAKVEGDASKVSVEVPKSSVGQLANQTEAALTVKTDIADVKIPAASVAELSKKSGSTITISAETVEDTVKVEVKVDGTPVEKLSGGVVASIPAQTGNVLVVVNPDGTETIVKKSIVDGGTVAGLVDGSCTVKIVENNKTFADTNTHWAKEAVEFAASRELFQGTGKDTFSPNAPMNRAMLATVLYRLEDAAASGSHSFHDVAENAWYNDAVTWANQTGIVTGTGTGFSPNGNVTREQLATMLYRYAKTLGMDTAVRGSLTGFADSGRTSAWAKDAMTWAVGNGLITGKGGSALDPSGSATRAEVAAILQRMVTLMVK